MRGLVEVVITWATEDESPVHKARTKESSTMCKAQNIRQLSIS